MTDGKEFFVVFSTPLVTGYMPVPIPRANPVLHWRGPKIDLVKSWHPALAFMSRHLKHEVCMRLFMTRARDEILVFPLTQAYGTGMSVKEEITKEEREWWAQEGLIEAGTVHSHCDMGAFASSTDKHDEQTRDGLHLTIGKLKSNQFDIHARMTWTIPGEEREGRIVRAACSTSQQPNLTEWFAMPSHVLEFIAQEPELEDSVIKYMLTKPPAKDVIYPEAWNAKLLERKYPQITPGYVEWNGPMYGHDREVARQQELSMAGDIPQKKNDKTEKSKILWETWQEVLSLIAESPACREMQVSVSDFEPEMRDIVFNHCPPASEVWVKIQNVIAQADLTQEEFFAEFGKDSRVL